jgi:hypothetical protein
MTATRRLDFSKAADIAMGNAIYLTSNESSVDRAATRFFHFSSCSEKERSSKEA